MTGTGQGERLRLYTMPYSPWSERARWALLHHGLPFEEIHHTPMLGELTLRLRAKQLGGKVSVPLLRDGETAVMDSMRIAQYADTKSGRSPLFPPESKTEIERLNGEFESMSQAGRIKLLQITRSSDEAAKEFLPAPLRSLPFAAASSRMGSNFIAKKHGVSDRDVSDIFRKGYNEIRKLLNGSAFILGDFTYADILAATAIQYLKPVDSKYVDLGPNTRAALTDPALVAEFGDLIAWRDALYAAHRPLPS